MDYHHHNNHRNNNDDDSSFTSYNQNTSSSNRRRPSPATQQTHSSNLRSRVNTDRALDETPASVRDIRELESRYNKLHNQYTELDRRVMYVNPAAVDHLMRRVAKLEKLVLPSSSAARRRDGTQQPSVMKVGKLVIVKGETDDDDDSTTVDDAYDYLYHQGTDDHHNNQHHQHNTSASFTPLRGSSLVGNNNNNHRKKQNNNNINHQRSSSAPLAASAARNNTDADLNNNESYLLNQQQQQQQYNDQLASSSFNIFVKFFLAQEESKRTIIELAEATDRASLMSSLTLVDTVGLTHSLAGQIDDFVSKAGKEYFFTSPSAKSKTRFADQDDEADDSNNDDQDLQNLFSSVLRQQQQHHHHQQDDHHHEDFDLENLSPLNSDNDNDDDLDSTMMTDNDSATSATQHDRQQHDNNNSRRHDWSGVEMNNTNNNNTNTATSSRHSSFSLNDEDQKNDDETAQKKHQLRKDKSSKRTIKTPKQTALSTTDNKQTLNSHQQRKYNHHQKNQQQHGYSPLFSFLFWFCRSITNRVNRAEKRNVKQTESVASQARTSQEELLQQVELVIEKSGQKTQKNINEIHQKNLEEKMTSVSEMMNLLAEEANLRKEIEIEALESCSLSLFGTQNDLRFLTIALDVGNIRTKQQQEERTSQEEKERNSKLIEESNQELDSRIGFVEHALWSLKQETDKNELISKTSLLFETEERRREQILNEQQHEVSVELMMMVKLVVNEKSVTESLEIIQRKLDENAALNSLSEEELHEFREAQLHLQSNQIDVLVEQVEPLSRKMIEHEFISRFRRESMSFEIKMLNKAAKNTNNEEATQLSNVIMLEESFARQFLISQEHIEWLSSIVIECKQEEMEMKLKNIILNNNKEAQFSSSSIPDLRQEDDDEEEQQLQNDDSFDVDEEDDQSPARNGNTKHGTNNKSRGAAANNGVSSPVSSLGLGPAGEALEQRLSEFQQQLDQQFCSALDAIRLEITHVRRRVDSNEANHGTTISEINDELEELDKKIADQKEELVSRMQEQENSNNQQEVIPASSSSPAAVAIVASLFEQELQARMNVESEEAISFSHLLFFTLRMRQSRFSNELVDLHTSVEIMMERQDHFVKSISSSSSSSSANTSIRREEVAVANVSSSSSSPQPVSETTIEQKIHEQVGEEMKKIDEKIAARFAELQSLQQQNNTKPGDKETTKTEEASTIPQQQQQQIQSQVEQNLRDLISQTLLPRLFQSFADEEQKKLDSLSKEAKTQSEINQAFYYKILAFETQEANARFDLSLQEVERRARIQLMEHKVSLILENNISTNKNKQDGETNSQEQKDNEQQQKIKDLIAEQIEIYAASASPSPAARTTTREDISPVPPHREEQQQQSSVPISVFTNYQANSEEELQQLRNVVKASDARLQRTCRNLELSDNLLHLSNSLARFEGGGGSTGGAEEHHHHHHHTAAVAATGDQQNDAENKRMILELIKQELDRRNQSDDRQNESSASPLSHQRQQQQQQQDSSSAITLLHRKLAERVASLEAKEIGNSALIQRTENENKKLREQIYKLEDDLKSEISKQQQLSENKQKKSTVELIDKKLEDVADQQKQNQKLMRADESSLSSSLTTTKLEDKLMEKVQNLFDDYTREHNRKETKRALLFEEEQEEKERENRKKEEERMQRYAKTIILPMLLDEGVDDTDGNNQLISAIENKIAQSEAKLLKQVSNHIGDSLIQVEDSFDEKLASAAEKDHKSIGKDFKRQLEDFEDEVTRNNTSSQKKQRQILDEEISSLEDRLQKKMQQQVANSLKQHQEQQLRRAATTKSIRERLEARDLTLARKRETTPESDSSAASSSSSSGEQSRSEGPNHRAPLSMDEAAERGRVKREQIEKRRSQQEKEKQLDDKLQNLNEELISRIAAVKKALIEENEQNIQDSENKMLKKIVDAETRIKEEISAEDDSKLKSIEALIDEKIAQSGQQQHIQQPHRGSSENNKNDDVDVVENPLHREHHHEPAPSEHSSPSPWSASSDKNAPVASPLDASQNNNDDNNNNNTTNNNNNNQNLLENLRSRQETQQQFLTDLQEAIALKTQEMNTNFNELKQHCEVALRAEIAVEKQRNDINEGFLAKLQNAIGEVIEKQHDNALRSEQADEHLTRKVEQIEKSMNKLTYEFEEQQHQDEDEDESNYANSTNRSGDPSANSTLDHNRRQQRQNQQQGGDGATNTRSSSRASSPDNVTNNDNNDNSNNNNVGSSSNLERATRSRHRNGPKSKPRQIEPLSDSGNVAVNVNQGESQQHPDEHQAQQQQQQQLQHVGSGGGALFGLATSVNSYPSGENSLASTTGQQQQQQQQQRRPHRGGAKSKLGRIEPLRGSGNVAVLQGDAQQHPVDDEDDQEQQQLISSLSHDQVKLLIQEEIKKALADHQEEQQQPENKKSSSSDNDEQNDENDDASQTSKNKTKNVMEETPIDTNSARKIEDKFEHEIKELRKDPSSSSSHQQTEEKKHDDENDDDEQEKDPDQQQQHDQEQSSATPSSPTKDEVHSMIDEILQKQQSATIESLLHDPRLSDFVRTQIENSKQQIEQTQIEARKQLRDDCTEQVDRLRQDQAEFSRLQVDSIMANVRQQIHSSEDLIEKKADSRFAELKKELEIQEQIRGTEMHEKQESKDKELIKMMEQREEKLKEDVNSKTQQQIENATKLAVSVAAQEAEDRILKKNVANEVVSAMKEDSEVRSTLRDFAEDAATKKTKQNLANTAIGISNNTATANFGSSANTSASPATTRLISNNDDDDGDAEGISPSRHTLNSNNNASSSTSPSPMMMQSHQQQQQTAHHPLAVAIRKRVQQEVSAVTSHLFNQSVRPAVTEEVKKQVDASMSKQAIRDAVAPRIDEVVSRQVTKSMLVAEKEKKAKLAALDEERQQKEQQFEQEQEARLVNRIQEELESVRDAQSKARDEEFQEQEAKMLMKIERRVREFKSDTRSQQEQFEVVNSEEHSRRDIVIEQLEEKLEMLLLNTSHKQSAQTKQQNEMLEGVIGTLEKMEQAQADKEDTENNKNDDDDDKESRIIEKAVSQARKELQEDLMAMKDRSALDSNREKEEEKKIDAKISDAISKAQSKLRDELLKEVEEKQQQQQQQRVKISQQDFSPPQDDDDNEEELPQSKINKRTPTSSSSASKKRTTTFFYDTPPPPDDSDDDEEESAAKNAQPTKSASAKKHHQSSSSYSTPPPPLQRAHHQSASDTKKTDSNQTTTKINTNTVLETPPPSSPIDSSSSPSSAASTITNCVGNDSPTTTDLETMDSDIQNWKQEHEIGKTFALEHAGVNNNTQQQVKSMNDPLDDDFGGVVAHHHSPSPDAPPGSYAHVAISTADPKNPTRGKIGKKKRSYYDDEYSNNNKENRTTEVEAAAEKPENNSGESGTLPPMMTLEQLAAELRASAQKPLINSSREEEQQKDHHQYNHRPDSDDGIYGTRENDNPIRSSASALDSTQRPSSSNNININTPSGLQQLAEIPSNNESRSPSAYSRLKIIPDTTSSPGRFNSIGNRRSQSAPTNTFVGDYKAEMRNNSNKKYNSNNNTASSSSYSSLIQPVRHPLNVNRNATDEVQASQHQPRRSASASSPHQQHHHHHRHQQDFHHPAAATNDSIMMSAGSRSNSEFQSRWPPLTASPLAGRYPVSDVERAQVLQAEADHLASRQKYNEMINSKNNSRSTTPLPQQQPGGHSLDSLHQHPSKSRSVSALTSSLLSGQRNRQQQQQKPSSRGDLYDELLIGNRRGTPGNQKLYDPTIDGPLHNINNNNDDVQKNENEIKTNRRNNFSASRNQYFPPPGHHSHHQQQPNNNIINFDKQSRSSSSTSRFDRPKYSSTTPVPSSSSTNAGVKNKSPFPTSSAVPVSSSVSKRKVPLTMSRKMSHKESPKYLYQGTSNNSAAAASTSSQHPSRSLDFVASSPPPLLQ